MGEWRIIMTVMMATFLVTMPVVRALYASRHRLQDVQDIATVASRQTFERLETACNSDSFRSLEVTNQADCEVACVQDPQCVAYEHEGEAGMCNIHTNANV